jgi:hypothetical protein
VLRAVREEQQHLRRRGQGAVAVIEQEAADGAADRRASRLLGQDGIRTQPGGKQARLRALPAPLDPLERDERHGAFYQPRPARP